ncbi:FtsW/RodA/SpoVE family cell cycle protein [Virgibacillus sp. W0181]|uniref:FtsW/RodA/SpoVE family cell cycle protein n=1 Tax=Virgibacillus sp. W0181 TaxID=3391581 RepID=UPI003F45773C
MPRKQSHYIQLDFIILLILFIGVSLLAIFNAQQLEQYSGENFVLKQTVFFAASIAILAAIQFVDLDQLYKASIFIYCFGVLLLVILHFSPPGIAKEINNAKSWFTAIPGFSLQPSEFTKIAFIIFLAAMISKHKEKFMKNTLKSDLLLLVKIIISTILPSLFILEQPDLGSAIVFIFIAGVLIILSGIDWKIIALLVLGSTVAIAATLLLIINFPDLSQSVLGIKPYQMDRVMTWFDPSQQTGDDRFQIDRSLLAVGSGQLIGKGMTSLQVYLPEAHTDFIFSVIGESFGFIGGAAIILLYFLLMYKLVTLGLKSYQFNVFGSFLCFGFLSLLLIHAFQNIGMTIGIMPITGIPLLLISYGGSSIISTMIGYALVYRVAVEYSRQNDYLFK